MADTTKIEWTDATWNPITGCTVHSAGCTNCYAMQLAGTRLRDHPSRMGLTRKVNGNHVWTGEVKFNEQWLLQPIQWKRPRDIFVCAHADLFHENVPDEWIDKIFAVMAAAHWHRYQILTKRSDRMRAYFARMAGSEAGRAADILANAANDIWFDDDTACAIANWVNGFSRWRDAPDDGNPLNGTVSRWPLPNVWLGVSVEDQRAADERIPDLLATPAAIRWLSCEPLLGQVDLYRIEAKATRSLIGGDFSYPKRINALTGYAGHYPGRDTFTPNSHKVQALNWVVVGGESGRNARPMHPSWARSLRDQCAAAGVAFHFKQIGEWGWIDPEKHHADYVRACNGEGPWPFDKLLDADGTLLPGDAMQVGSRQYVRRVGKKAAGRLLDGVLHDGRPA